MAFRLNQNKNTKEKSPESKKDRLKTSTSIWTRGAPIVPKHTPLDSVEKMFKWSDLMSSQMREKQRTQYVFDIMYVVHIVNDVTAR